MELLHRRWRSTAPRAEQRLLLQLRSRFVAPHRPQRELQHRRVQGRIDAGVLAGTGLAAHTNSCVLAYWHQPRFGSGNGKLANNKSVAVLWNDLVAAHADLVLNGHRHYYERFARMDASGAASATGVREFIVGTGGKSLAGHIDAHWPSKEVFDFTHYGVLELTLHPTSYDWSFVAIDGSIIDSGTDTCSV